METTGFSIFSRKDKLELFRQIAQARGLIILTDSDGAGFVIRNYLTGALPTHLVKHAYIPDIHGKESRKRNWSSEQKLGVEGMSPAVIEEALRRCGATFLEEDSAPTKASEPITKTDLFLCGLTGGEGSSARRKALLKSLSLPEHLSTNAMLPVLNSLYSREAFFRFVESLP